MQVLALVAKLALALGKSMAFLRLSILEQSRTCVAGIRIRLVRLAIQMRSHKRVALKLKHK